MHNWSFDPLEAARGLAGPPGDEPSWRAVDFAGIASWVVDGMHYLHDLDPFNLSDDRVVGYQVAQRQLAHARWTVGDAITAVDLCAAALGRLFANYPKGSLEMDLRGAEQQLLPHPVAGPWISEVVSDPDYKRVLEFRKAGVHRIISRHATVSMAHGTVLHEFSPTLHGSRVEVGALPGIARGFATRHVEAFLRRALCGALAPTTP
jgi:hypothetical protein